MPRRVQGGDPNWIEPLRLQARQLWSRRNPFFAHAEARAWLALQGGEPVGRISAQVDRLQADQGRAGVGWFGQLEAIDSPMVFLALVDAAASWLKEQGMHCMQGPFDLSINQQCGLLTEGFGRPPTMMMGHAPPYYRQRLGELGFVPAATLLAYEGSTEFRPPAAMAEAMRRLGSRIRVESPAASELAGRVEVLRALYNDAWQDNWGFVPFTEAEFRHAAAEMKPLVRPGYVQLAWFDGEPAGFMVTLPDVNQLIGDLQGRLLPAGFFKLIWRLYRRRYTHARVALMGLARAHRRGLRGAALTGAMMAGTGRAMRRDGVEAVEQSWVLEQNYNIRRLIESLGMQVSKKYQILERELELGF